MKPAVSEDLEPDPATLLGLRDVLDWSSPVGNACHASGQLSSVGGSREGAGGRNDLANNHEVAANSVSFT